MKNRIIWLLLVVTACFTISFAIGYVRAGRNRWQPPTVEEEVNFLAARASLNEEQKQAFVRYRSGVRAKRRELRKANSAVTEAYWVEVMKPHPDPAKLEQFTERTLAVRQAYDRFELEGWHDFIRLLDDRQKRIYMEIIKSNNEKKIE
jgi:outer membrane PBP1 activator LpoA protein